MHFYFNLFLSKSNGRKLEFLISWVKWGDDMYVWGWLLVAIFFEVAGTTSLKISHGLTKLIPSICTFVFYGISFCALAFSLKKLDIGIAYAIWSGIGTAAIACIGIFYFGESVSLLKIISFILIIIGVIGLRIANGTH